MARPWTGIRWIPSRGRIAEKELHEMNVIRLSNKAKGTSRPRDIRNWHKSPRCDSVADSRRIVSQHELQLWSWSFQTSRQLRAYLGWSL
ncbi:hypothetical protein J6590_017708 [Homalodisca vitripennis]|nr:hypothetical protein J6590_017708 [Homalodisca vitripennis]